MASTTAVSNGTTATDELVSQTADGIVLMPPRFSVQLVGVRTDAVLTLAGALSAAVDKKTGRSKLQRAWYGWTANKAKLVDGLDVGFNLIDDTGVITATPVVDETTGQVVNPSKPKPKRHKTGPSKGQVVTRADGSTVLEGGGNPTKRWTARLVINGQPYQFKATVTDVLKNNDGTPRFFMDLAVFPVAQSQGHAIPEFEGEGLSF